MYPPVFKKRKRQEMEMNIRLATMQDLDRITRLEAICFPPEEAADREAFRKRLEIFPNHFWLLEENIENENQLISVINGMVTDIPVLVDEMFADAGMHNEDGKWQMIFGVETSPQYQRSGYAKTLMKQVIADCKEAGRKGIMLTCKEELIPFYEQFGYINEGISMSKHGGAVWYDMRLSF